LGYVLDFSASGVSNTEKIRSNTSYAYIHDYIVEYCEGGRITVLRYRNST